MAKLDFDKLEDAIEYIKENEKKIDDYDNLNTTFENYKTKTDDKILKLEKSEKDLQSANMTLYLQTCQGTNEDKKSLEDKEDKEDKEMSFNEMLDKL